MIIITVLIDFTLNQGLKFGGYYPILLDKKNENQHRWY